MRSIYSFTVLVFLLGPAQTRADELQLQFSGAVQSDLRFRTDDKSVGDFYKRLEWKPGVARNENRLELGLEAALGKVKGVADLRFVWLGMPEQVAEIGQLADRNVVDPYYLEVRSAYLEASDLILPGLDLRAGYQLVLWGVGDQFNPTNNLNANDVEDILLFGDQRSNFMLKLDYNFLEQWSVSGVLVPVFQQAQLPRSAPLGTALIERTPFSEEQLRWRVAFENAVSATFGYPVVVDQVEARLPERNFENMPFAFRLAGNLLGQDIAVSYYRGRHDFPLPLANHASQQAFAEELCDPADANRCIKGVMSTQVALEYPRMQVLGFNLAGEIPLDWISEEILGIGYRLELGVYLPEKREFTVTQDRVLIGPVEVPAGEYNYMLGGKRPTIVDDTPFLKWVLGFDYSFGPHWMINLMWVHGMADEFGAGDFLHPGYVVRDSWVVSDDPMGCLLEHFSLTDPDWQAKAAVACGRESTHEILRPRLGDYAVAGVDFKFADDRALLRLFAIWDVSGYYETYYDEQAGQRVKKYLNLFDEGFSMILFPEFKFNFKNGLELGAGALLQLGNRYTKFGDPAAGGSLVWTRARFSF